MGSARCPEYLESALAKCFLSKGHVGACTDGNGITWCAPERDMTPGLADAGDENVCVPARRLAAMERVVEKARAIEAVLPPVSSFTASRMNSATEALRKALAALDEKEVG